MTEEKIEDKRDLYAEITRRFIAILEEGVRPWHQPWANGKAAGNVALPVRANGIRYRGVNVLLLWADFVAKGYGSPVWITYDQAKAQGGHIRKGERGTMIVFTGAITETSEPGEENERDLPEIKHYTLFNLDQADGLPESFYPRPPEPRSQSQRIEAADAFIRATGAMRRHGGDKAFYEPGLDFIQMPSVESFSGPEAYYAIALRESIRWTKHKTRLNRDFGQNDFGEETRAEEELVAELGAAFLCAELGITAQIREGDPDYIGDWPGILDYDTLAIFRCATRAQQAADYLKSLQPKPSGPVPEDPPATSHTSESESTATPPSEVQQPPKKDRRRRQRKEAPAPQ